MSYEYTDVFFDRTSRCHESEQCRSAALKVAKWISLVGLAILVLLVCHKLVKWVVARMVGWLFNAVGIGGGGRSGFGPAEEARNRAPRVTVHMDSSGKATDAILPPYTPRKHPPPYQMDSIPMNNIEEEETEQSELLVDISTQNDTQEKANEEPLVTIDVPNNNVQAEPENTSGEIENDDKDGDLVADMGFTLIDLE